MTRIDDTFARLKSQGKKAFVAYVMAGDPDEATSLEVVKGLPAAGVDIIELGMPFTDPMADGPTIQAAGQRALEGGMTMDRVLAMVRAFRADDNQTPIVLMGYYNPIWAYGVTAFVADARKAGVDGLIIVDLPPEEAEELYAPAAASGLDLIFLAAPTTDDSRLPRVLACARGFLYYVSITGVTGTRSADAVEIDAALARIRRHTDLPVAVGFGIRTPEQAAEVARTADAAVVGSALVSEVARHLDASGAPDASLVDSVTGLVASLARGVRTAARVARG